MAEATKTTTVDVSAEKLMNVIKDFVKYPEFVVGCSSAKMLSDSEPKRVEYNVEIMGKKITYVLDHKTESPTRLSWTLVNSNLMKENRGLWDLKALGPNKTEVTYSLALDLNFSVPGFIMNTLVKGSLPAMIESFAQRAKKVG